MNMMEQIRRAKQDPAEMVRRAGWEIPAEAMGDPKAMVMHLINSGQVSGPALEKVMPLIRQMNGR